MLKMYIDLRIFEWIIHIVDFRYKRNRELLKMVAEAISDYKSFVETYLDKEACWYSI